MRWTLKTQPYEIYEIQQKQNRYSQFFEEIQSDTGLLQKQEKHQVTTYHLKELEKEEHTQPSQQKEVNNKD